MASRLVEKPQLIVPFSLLGVGWFMLAHLTVRQQHPSPWNRIPPISHFVYLLRTGKAHTPVTAIKEYEGHKEALAYEETFQKRVEEDAKLAEKQAELQQEIDSKYNDDIATKMATAAIPLDLLNKLGRVQGIIGGICAKMRLVRVICTWEESVVSFWITAAFLTAGAVALVLPWGFILTWTGRLVVWGFLGPHMKLVDWFLQSNEKKDGSVKTMMQNFDVKSNVARVSQEEAMKLKVIREMAFGKFSLQVPSFNLGKYTQLLQPYELSSTDRLNFASPLLISSSF